jgi:hypothetical protein
MSTANVVAGTGGLDASIMFETDRAENIGAAFNTSLGNLLGYYSPRASMSDLVALSVYAATRSCEGPIIPVKAGRVDAIAAGPTGVPLPTDSTNTLITKFESQGFNQSEMVALVACGHTLGGVHGQDFPTLVRGEGVDGNEFSHFDGTYAAFDSRVCSDFINNNSTDPLIVGPDNSMQSDLRVFTIDRALMQAMIDPTVFATTCGSLMQRMIETVPAEVVLTDPLAPYEVKPANLVLEVSEDGSSIGFTGVLRVRTTVRPASDIASVQLLFTDRDGATGTIDAPAATYAGGSATGFDENFQVCLFSLLLASCN